MKAADGYLHRKHGEPVSLEWIYFNAVPEASGCLVWIGSRTVAGYGFFGESGKQKYAHRTSYEMSRGEIPNGLVIDHLCRTPACVNPDHMEPVTIKENTRRGNAFKHRDGKCPRCGSADLFKDKNGRATRCRPCRNTAATDRARRRMRDPALRAERAEYMRLYHINRKQKVST